jgi:UBA-like domain
MSGSGDMADTSELVAQFCAITGAAPHVAENYLLAHEHDLERSVDFYFQHPPHTDLHQGVQQRSIASSSPRALGATLPTCCGSNHTPAAL